MGFADKMFQAAEVRESVKRRLNAILGELPEDHQVGMLADLVLERKPPEVSEEEEEDGPEPAEITSPEPPVVAKKATTRKLAPKTKVLVEYLRKHQDSTIAAITTAVYESELETDRAKIRSMLHSLLGQGRVKKGSAKGLWKAA